jgi:hypothetical protein
MPSEPRNPRLNTGRLIRGSHNTKDPPERSLRRERNKVVSNDLGVFAQQTSSARRQEFKAQDQQIEAMRQYTQALEWSKEFNERFVEYFSGIPCNEEYYLLYDDCWARFAVLGTGPDPHTIQEVLETFGPPRRSANVKRSTHTGERGSGSPPFISSRMSCHSSSLSPHEDVRLVPTEREVFGTSQLCARNPDSTRQLRYHSPSRDTSLVSQYVSSLGLAVPEQPKDPIVVPIRAAAEASKATPAVESRGPPLRVEARAQASPSRAKLGVDPDARTLMLPEHGGRSSSTRGLWGQSNSSRETETVSRTSVKVWPRLNERGPLDGVAKPVGPPDGSLRIGGAPAR